MHFAYELTPDVFADYSLANEPAPGCLPAFVARWLARSGPHAQEIELTDEGVTDLIRASGEPEFFPWDAFEEVWIAPTWIALRLSPEDLDDDFDEVEAIVIPVEALPEDGLAALENAFPALADLPHTYGADH